MIKEQIEKVKRIKEIRFQDKTKKESKVFAGKGSYQNIRRWGKLSSIGFTIAQKAREYENIKEQHGPVKILYKDGKPV